MKIEKFERAELTKEFKSLVEESKKSILEKENKVEDKKEFKLERGMKFKTLDTVELIPENRNKVFIVRNIVSDRSFVQSEDKTLFERKFIDWEATKELNEIVEEVPESKVEPFELEVGMKFKTLDNEDWKEDIRNKIFTVNEIGGSEECKEYGVKGHYSIFDDYDIDWKETRKLNEVGNKVIEFDIGDEVKITDEDHSKYKAIGNIVQLEELSCQVKIMHNGWSETVYAYYHQIKKIEEIKEEITESKGYLIIDKKNIGEKVFGNLKEAEKKIEEAIMDCPNKEFIIVEMIKVAKGKVVIEWEK